MVKLPRRLRRDTKLQLLAATPAFGECRPADLVALAAAADIVACDEGDLLAFQDDPRRRWWFVLEGRLEILWNWSWPSRLESGQAFGADRADRSDPPGHADHLPDRRDRATIVASVPSVVLVAPRTRLLGLIDEHPRLADAMQRASADLVGQEFEELLRRTGDDRPVTADHDGPLDKDGIGRQSVEHLVTTRSGQTELGEERLTRAGDHDRVVGAQQPENPLELGARRRLS
ncbi:MAG TPA: cyclic nucleotide-binding domain-containing protein [Acidimicrobiales bacterium]|nr:cyclic nucleotide-binding domain-containing protein [Acidimicrobiales bacterium]